MCDSHDTTEDISWYLSLSLTLCLLCPHWPTPPHPSHDHQALVDAAFAANRDFFALPSEVKAALASRPSTSSGYHSSCTVCVGAKGQAAPESRELIRYAATDCDVSKHPGGWPAHCRHLLDGPAAEGLPLWPAEAPASTSSVEGDDDAAAAAGAGAACVPAGYKSTVLSYFSAVNGLAKRLMAGAAEALGQAPDALLADDAAAPGPVWATLSLVHYPGNLPSDPSKGIFGAAAHKDRFCCFTVLANTPDSTGLEALTADGQWYEVPPKPGCFVVNVGSLLELWSGGRFPASVHRVANRDGRERYAIAFFRGNARETLVRPLLPPVNEGDVRAGAAATQQPQQQQSTTEGSIGTGGVGEVATDCTTCYKPVLFGDYLDSFKAAFSNKLAPSGTATAGAGAAAVQQVAVA